MWLSTASHLAAELEPVPSDLCEPLWSPTAIRTLLQRHGIRAVRSLGQHFLADQNVLKKILSVANPKEEERILEVGPGFGVLTRAIAERAGSVVAIDIDSRMVTVSRSTTADLRNVEIREGDILATPLCDLFGGFPRDKCHIIANLPYGISKPVLRKFTEEREAFSSLTVMVQKEVARRIVARPGASDYGPIAIAFRLYGEARIAGSVARDCFFPPPEVDSSLVRADLRVEPQYPVRHEERFFQVVRSAFAQRRKTLINALESGLASEDFSGRNNIPLTRDELRERIADAGIDARRRGETLTVEEFVRLAEILHPDNG